VARVDIGRWQRPDDQIAAACIAQIQNLAPAIGGLIRKRRKEVVVIVGQQARLGTCQRNQVKVIDRDPPENIADKPRTVDVISSRELINVDVVLVLRLLHVFEDAKCFIGNLHAKRSDSVHNGLQWG
jgi:hypothetical protein